MEIIIRRMTTEDAAGVNRLSAQLGYPLPPEQTLQNIKAVLASSDHDAFVAVYENKVIGWIGVGRSVMIELPPFGEINGLVIDENFRGKGVGKLLVEKARQWAKEKRLDKLSLRCNVKRTEAHSFYHHLGFKDIKKQTNFEMNI